MSKVIQNSLKIRHLNNSTILQTKRGKNNPDHMFVRPKNTKNPSKFNLERLMIDDGSTKSQVPPPGTYNSHLINTMGKPAKDEEYLKKLKSQMGSNYSMMKIEDKNKKWIARARKDYMAKVDDKEKNKKNLKFSFQLIPKNIRSRS